MFPNSVVGFLIMRFIYSLSSRFYQLKSQANYSSPQTVSKYRHIFLCQQSPTFVLFTLKSTVIFVFDPCVNELTYFMVNYFKPIFKFYPSFSYLPYINRLLPCPRCVSGFNILLLEICFQLYDLFSVICI